jgi:(E)-4-hydroxy-3-methylbut-2-enyl-diphosphate synthase
MSNINTPYISSIVHIGTVPLGGDNPIRIQSMTNTDTLDTKASVAQCIRIIEAGADFIRLTAQGTREAENLANIKKKLFKAGFETPLIADIHFNPSAAEVAAAIVEKVRINPGNYADKRASFTKVDLSEKEYNEELERIHSRLLPLINTCHLNKTAIRVGVNHGSLSDRIMTRYGNTPAGMAISAMEFIRIFRAENFHSLVLSMKSSDTSVMIEATRMLVTMMTEQDYAYPLHLGVTEAGEGEDGRVRSAAGIGALLSEGIGDTIRVSLSEDPENEIPVARKLVKYFPRGIASTRPEKQVIYKTPAEKPDLLKHIKGPIVIANMTSYVALNIEAYKEAGYFDDKESGELIRSDGAADLIITTNCPEVIPARVSLVVPYKVWFSNRNAERVYPLFSPETFAENLIRHEKLNLVLTGSHFNIEMMKRVDSKISLIIFTFNPEKERYAADKFMNALEENSLSFNIILNPVFTDDNPEDLQIKASSLIGRYLNDKMISGISIAGKGSTGLKETNALCFSILQCTGTRITRTMFLSCPTCGRTKFNLQESVKKVKEKTGHLKGLKIAVMGCIVNGPGEMAGADWGYVGAADGKVHIYKGTVPVLKNVPEKNAADELLKLIEKDHTSL